MLSLALVLGQEEVVGTGSVPGSWDCCLGLGRHIGTLSPAFWEGQTSALVDGVPAPTGWIRNLENVERHAIKQQKS